MTGPVRDHLHVAEEMALSRKQIKYPLPLTGTDFHEQPAAGSQVRPAATDDPADDIQAVLPAGKGKTGLPLPHLRLQGRHFGFRDIRRIADDQIKRDARRHGREEIRAEQAHPVCNTKVTGIGPGHGQGGRRTVRGQDRPGQLHGQDNRNDPAAGAQVQRPPDSGPVAKDGKDMLQQEFCLRPGHEDSGRNNEVPRPEFTPAEDILQRLPQTAPADHLPEPGQVSGRYRITAMENELAPAQAQNIPHQGQGLGAGILDAGPGQGMFRFREQIAYQELGVQKPVVFGYPPVAIRRRCVARDAQLASFRASVW